MSRWCETHPLPPPGRSERHPRLGLPLSVPATLLVALVVALAAAGATGARPIRSPFLYWGAYVGGGQYGLADAPWDMQSARLLEAHAGKGLSLLEWGQSWLECAQTRCGLQPFRADLFERVRSYGAIPVLSWGSAREQHGSDQPAFRLAEIIRGRYDSFIRRWAEGARRWGRPFFLRFDWEMNIADNAWGEAVNGNAAGEFVRMWRHVHDIFRQVHATNVTWVWCPNIDFPGQVPLRRLYPGDTYVDWVCLDGYNWGDESGRPTERWTPFVKVFERSLSELRAIAPTKPVMIGETASSERGGSKAAWLADALRRLPERFPQVRAIVWFNKNWDGMDWVIETSRAAEAAFAEAIGSSIYVPNRFARLVRSPIPPPG